MLRRRDFLGGFAAFPLLGAAANQANGTPTLDSISDRTHRFHLAHPVCDMLGLNLTHPRFLVDNIDLGRRNEDTCRGDFPKFRDWGMSVVMCKGGPKEYDAEFTALWKEQPERRPGREGQPLSLTLAFKNPTQLVLAVLDRFLLQVEANRDQVLLVRQASDLDAAPAQGKIALLMGANRSDWFGDTLGVLRMAARIGLRMITLGQDTRELGYDPYSETRSGGRLTELGVQVLRELNRAGILIDISHLNDPCSLDALEISEKPAVASHSNPRKLIPGARSIPDDIMRALAKNGGVLGLVPPIMRPAGERPMLTVPASQLEATVNMIRYAVDVMGIDHVGIGTHFNTTVIPWVTDALLRASFSDEETAKVMGGNYLRVLRAVLPA
ncbi:MAG: dipeptidase [Terriglobia bacterium]